MLRGGWENNWPLESSVFIKPIQVYGLQRHSSLGIDQAHVKHTWSRHWWVRDVCLMKSWWTLAISKMFDIAQAFYKKKSAVRSFAATAPPPEVQPQQSATLAPFEPVTEDKIQSILATASPTSCPLDPLRTWLLKKLAPNIIPVICSLSNLSLQTGSFPSCVKRAFVYPHIKKPSMD